jgi:RNA polymerase sigma-70 factor (ECF subfamily)
MNPNTQIIHERPESDLITDSRKGDRDAMTELFRRHYPCSVAVARRMLPAQDEFLDAVQSAYFSAFREFNSFRGEASFKTWITRIVVNHCLMHIRKLSRRRVTVSLDQSGPGDTRPWIAAADPTPEDLAIRAEIGRAVAHAVRRLPKPLGDVFTRRAIWGSSTEDTAHALGLTMQASKTRLFRARSQMRQELKQLGEAGETRCAASRARRNETTVKPM